ncbi:MAG: hypothetical protein KDB27_23465 [Planctomycetales bacterium]|nr:hypothetical protein [Planctomycetales bacterium]
MHGLLKFFDAILNAIDGFLKATIGPPLRAFHAPIDNMLGSLPMSVAMACVLGLYAIAVIWVWRLKKEFVFRGAPSESRIYDLRIWATLVVVPYVVVYVLLGR